MKNFKNLGKVFVLTALVSTQANVFAQEASVVDVPVVKNVASTVKEVVPAVKEVASIVKEKGASLVSKVWLGLTNSVDWTKKQVNNAGQLVKNSADAVKDLPGNVAGFVSKNYNNVVDKSKKMAGSAQVWAEENPKTVRAAAITASLAVTALVVYTTVKYFKKDKKKKEEKTA